MTATDNAENRRRDGNEPSWLARLLDFDRAGDTFVVRTIEAGPAPRLFGGLIAAQALAAAGRTVDADKPPHSLHAYFVRGGHYDAPLHMQVQRIRTGRSFDTRQVSVRQDDAVILELIASFHHPEPGADWHPDVESALPFDTSVPKQPVLQYTDRFEIRTDPRDRSPYAVPPYWIRTRDPLGDDPLICACALTFISDLGPVPAVRPPGTELDFGSAFATSLDHSIWFHRRFAPHQWHRYEVAAANNSDSRGLARGALYDRAGALVASTAQEALWRV
ncbi:thioesterase family protein [Mycobacterium koreense]|uniref:Acyl-CoA thioesterase II n=1 Tax=Mycolicibacillus koreensis TaxID=1069220 RepID=A0A7I7S9Q7_9MYCO|nr:acyl-CoA thioesterase domain-containing protein [Mycolicibacillus koreensis]MCV7248780.1 thioesterase family protein [Mycolicibacillus koreensis]OSC36094.1 acyl-CoA thioesterase II [Mycolicibacillus koreensis]BBY53624.1 acyl-CoA thioesterase II [Mycolicibacillus koreensis]